MTDPRDLERLREAFACSEEIRSTDEVDAERIFRAVLEESSPQERREVVAELASSPAAAEAWRLAHELRQLAGLELETPQEKYSSRWGSGQWWQAAAATVMISLAAGLLLWFQQPEEKESVVRTLKPEVIESRVGEEGCDRSACRLAWTGVEGAISYRLRLTTEALVPLAEESGLGETEYQIPSTILSAVPPEEGLFWQVVATFDGGEEVPSVTFFLRLDEPGSPDR